MTFLFQEGRIPSIFRDSHRVLCIAEIEIILGKVGEAAFRLKARLDMIYAVQTDGDGRNFSGLHDTLLPLSATARSAFQQLRGTRAKKSRKPKTSGAGAAPNAGLRPINGRLHGIINGVDMRHILLLLPFLLFNLLEDEICAHNTRHRSNHSGPASVLISVVLALLEWYHLYRRAEKYSYSVVLCIIV